MNKIKYIIGVVAALAGTFSCDNYIDVTPTGKITVDSTETYYDLVALPNRSYYPSAFALLSDNQWSKESNIIGNEYISWDGMNMTFNEDADRTELSDNNLYENCYTYILRSNIVISLIDNSTGDSEIKELAKAEAKIMRAWDYFILINTFAKAYDPSTATNDGGIGIISEYDLEAKPAKSSVKDVYDFIINDIEEALPLLEETPSTVYHPSKAFGYAFASKVYLFHRDWSKAKEYAEKSLSLKNDLIDYLDLKSKGGPTKYTGYAKGNNPEVLNYAYMGSYSENIAYTYGMISPELVQLYGSNDLRLSLFFKTTGNSVYYFDNGSGAALWNTSITYSKFQPMVVGMRTAEVYLILAEAYARNNEINNTISTLNTLRAKRINGDEAVLSTPSSLKEAMELVITERRKELPFGFHRFWDLKRFNTESDYAKTIVRTFPIVSTDVEHKTYTLSPNSDMYIVPFPKAVYEKNPNITPNTNK